jgi:hypothetical protein
VIRPPLSRRRRRTLFPAPGARLRAPMTTDRWRPGELVSAWRSLPTLRCQSIVVASWSPASDLRSARRPHRWDRCTRSRCRRIRFGNTRHSSASPYRLRSAQGGRLTQQPVGPLIAACRAIPLPSHSWRAEWRGCRLTHHRRLAAEELAHSEESRERRSQTRCSREIRLIHSFASRSRAAWLLGASAGGTIRTNRAGFAVSGMSETAWLSHAPGTIRTCGLCLRRAALYPLSYGRVEGGESTRVGHQALRWSRGRRCR